MQTPAYRLVRSLVAIAVGVFVLALCASRTIPWTESSTLLTFAMVVLSLVGGVRVGVLTAAAYAVLVLVPQAHPLLDRLPGVGLELLPSRDALAGLGSAAALVGLLSHHNAFLRLWLAGVLGFAAVFAVPVAIAWTGALPEGLWDQATPHMLWGTLQAFVAAALVGTFRTPVHEVD